MLRAGEHVHRRGAEGAVAVGGEVFEVAGEGDGVAGDVDHARGAQGADGAEEVLVAAGAGRVHHQHVEGALFGGHAQQEAARVVAM